MKKCGKRRYDMFLKFVSALILGSVLAGCLPPLQLQAAAKPLSVETAKNMALSQSDKYLGLKNELELAQVEYVDAIQSIKEKERNQRTFRWSPLLNFKFPEKPDLAEEFEYTYKPLELQAEIDMLNHSLTDCVYGVYETVSLSFVKAYVLQESIAYNEERKKNCETALEKNKRRLVSGLASQTDVENLEKDLKNLNNTIASDKRSFEAAKEKLGGMIGIDISTSYVLENPFVSATLDRTIEEELIEYTLEHDDTYYQAKEAAANGLLELDTNYDLMRNQYGSKLQLIDKFIYQVKNGEKLDSAEFKLSYKELLKNVDARWQGKKKILFISIPKEWFKGAIDGVRYVEDEPYALYESAVKYQGLYFDEQTAKKELISGVKNSYENYVSTQNTCLELEQQIEKTKKDLDAAMNLNVIGELSYEEYMQVKEEYESLQMDLLNAKSAHSETLYSFDRLTCGALTAYLKGESLKMSSAEGGLSYVVEDKGEGVYYYIHSMVENNVFELGLSVPDDLDISITDFELWVNGVQIGGRTEISKNIRHLALDINNVDKAFIRLYDGDTVVDDCTFNPSVYSDKLIVRSYRVETAVDDLVGTYAVENIRQMNTLELSFYPAADQPIKFYNIKTADGTYLVSDAKVSIEEKFRYLGLAANSLEDLTICLYDRSEKLLYEAQFRSVDQTLRKKGE